ncbi:glutamine amidotransferase [Marisediminicola senii]|uniref:glutamine amidotransferase n=1 Tax=Marisediminicola senii TaxID=2711233 RepID=UPI0013EDDED4|nr:glutamine amidotransferase [Marisediminicola senii]
MKPFLLLATRAEDEAADGEYEAFRAAGGLTTDQLVRIRLESEPMPPIDLDDWSGIIVGGSPYNASDAPDDKSAVQLRVEAELSELLDQVVARDFPFLGACYGVGLLGRHQQGVVDRTWSEPIGPTRVTLTPDGRADPVFGELQDSFDAFVGHKEACRVLPAGAVLLASGTRCPVQAFRIKQNVFATQFHPELTVDGIVTRIRVYRDYGYFRPHEMDALIAEVQQSAVTEPASMIASFVRRYAAESLEVTVR